MLVSLILGFTIATAMPAIAETKPVGTSTAMADQIFGDGPDGARSLDPDALRRWIGDPETSLGLTEFGAAGNGTTDDTAAFAAAIAKLEAAGGGILDVPPGDYPVAIDITAGNVWIRCAPGTILRAAGSRAVFRVAPTAEKVVLTDADIRGRTKAAEEAKSRKPTALHGVEIRGADVILDRVRAEGFRVDSLYMSDNASNVHLNDSTFGDTARNSVSIVNGRNINFYGGRIWNAGQYTSGKYASLYLFDIEPSRGQSVDHVNVFGTVFEGNSPVSGAGLVIVTDGHNASGRTNVLFQGTRHFGTNAGGGALRLLNGKGGTIKGVTVRDAIFANRVIINGRNDATIIEDSLFENIEVGSAKFLYGARLGNGAVIRRLQSSAGPITALPVAKGANPRFE